jgi:hypothetical protein
VSTVFWRASDFSPFPNRASGKKSPEPFEEWVRAFERFSGGVLLSHTVAHAVPSALKSLTAVFGMGTGVTSSLSPPKKTGISQSVYNLGIKLQSPAKRSFDCTNYFVAKPHDRLVPVS